MASQLGIYNRALQILGAARVQSTSDGTKNQRACATAYDACRLALLERHTWLFAIERAELAADSPAPTWGRANAFTLPSDFLRLVEDYPEDNFNTKDWEIEGKKILTNDSAPLYVRYVADITDVQRMTPLFREALAASMAEAMAEEITQSNSKKEYASGLYERTIRDARKSNAFQRVAQESAEDTWITVRM